MMDAFKQSFAHAAGYCFQPQPPRGPFNPKTATALEGHRTKNRTYWNKNSRSLSDSSLIKLSLAAMIPSASSRFDC